MHRIITALPLLGLLALAACGGSSPAPSPPASASRRPPPIIAAPTLQVIGSDAARLIAAFGAPILDQREGPARKLQFRGAACVLDAYLYPPAAGGTPRVKWVDTRSPRGIDVDRAGCIAALSRR